MDQLNLSTFGSVPNADIGHVEAVYLAYSQDEDIQLVAASGGVVSSVLIGSLLSHKIDGVYLLTPNHEGPFYPKSNFANDKLGVLKAAGSTYWPAPIGKVLREIKRGQGKYAFVGLPCQIQSLRKAQQFDRRLSSKITFCIGIYCGGRPTIQGQKFAFKRYGIQPSSVSSIQYRHPEWPGHLRVILKTGEEIHIKKTKQLQGFAGQLFSHPRCLLCHDATAELADISTGDAWRLEDIRLPQEKSILAVRSQAGARAIKDAVSLGSLKIREIENAKLAHSQKRPIMHKHHALPARLKVAKVLFRRETPKITASYISQTTVNPTELIYAVRTLLINSLTAMPMIQKLMGLLPMSLLKRYSNFDRYDRF